MTVATAKALDNQVAQQSELARLIARHIRTDGLQMTAIPRLALLRSSQPSEPLPTVYEPALCVVGQGRKQVILGEEVYFYDQEQYLVVSVDLPVVSQVIQATPAKPYLCLKFDLDTNQLSALMMELGTSMSPAPRPERLGRGLSINPTDPLLLEAMIRLLRLLETPQDIPILAPLLEREILYRLLVGAYSNRVRQIALTDNRVVSVNRAISWLKQNYAAPFRIETLAREARMSPSALHHSFKAVTAMSPLQYQKQLRLQEARRLMLGQALDAATASHHVGYESPSQFSREYSRLFGAPPSRDIARLKEVVRATSGVGLASV